MTKRLYGRLPRTYDQRLPHYSSLTAGRRAMLAPAPKVVDRMSMMALPWGMMKNDTLSDCTCAGLAHAVQLTSFVTGGAITPTDMAVVQLYKNACGYRPGRPETDRGGIEQNVLAYVRQHGIPTGGKPVPVFGAVEVDARNLADLKRVIWESGFVYVGADVPSDWEQTTTWLMPAQRTPPAGGHCFILGGYDDHWFYGVSWGEVVRIDPAAITACVDEAYAVPLGTWFGPSGVTLAGLTPAQLEQAMQSLSA